MYQCGARCLEGEKGLEPGEEHEAITAPRDRKYR